MIFRRNTKFFNCVLAVVFLAWALPASAESLVDGIYISEPTRDGDSICTLEIKSIDVDAKYGDEVFDLESSGEGACNWTAIGLSKSYDIVAGLVSNGGATAFVTLEFPFGPAGKKIELVSIDGEGNLRFRETLNKQ